MLVAFGKYGVEKSELWSVNMLWFRNILLNEMVEKSYVTLDTVDIYEDVSTSLLVLCER